MAYFCLSAMARTAMLTKYILHINNSAYELRRDDLKNWDDVSCSYKRADLGGVVRSFTSKFEFVNRAYDLILEAYLKDGFLAEASIEVQTINDRWIYETRYACPLDFSTITWTGRVLGINCVDNSLAALIKANKGTKYEFNVGSEIPSGQNLLFDRLLIKENLIYEITGGSHYEDIPDIYVSLDKGQLPYIGNTEYETAINGIIDWNDDQSYRSSSYIFKARKDVDVNFDYDLSWRTDDGFQRTHLKIQVRRNGVILEDYSEALNGAGSNIAIVGSTYGRSSGNYSSPTDLPEPDYNKWALINGIVWFSQYNGRFYQWVNTGKAPDEYFKGQISGQRILSLRKDDEVLISHEIAAGFSQTRVEFRIISSRFQFSWMAKGDPVKIPTLRPSDVAKALLEKIANGKVDVDVSFSGLDSRFANTAILAAESVRGIPNAKFYSSFNEFADWMSVVFGYDYYIQSAKDGRGKQTVHFAHRSEILSATADVRRLERCVDIKYSVDSSLIYSNVTIGYEKKDYDSVNGRDEFNFNNTYSTGCSVTDKKLSLLSKYRADCYGIEFAVQKRGKDTTDSDSDQDVFFVLCEESEGQLVPDRSAEIENAISGSVFNGAFSPMACVMANAGLIGLQAGNMTLAFASTTGNGNIRVNGFRLNSDLQIGDSLATCGILEFTTDVVDMWDDAGEIIEVSGNGVTYRGFLSDVDIKYAHSEAAKFKLIVKEILV